MGHSSHNYVGHTLKYGNSSFKIEKKNVANGFIHHIQEGDFEGNVLEWKIAAQTIGPMMETTTICFV